MTHALPYLIIRSLNRGIVSQLTETLVLLEGFRMTLKQKKKQNRNNQRTEIERFDWFIDYGYKRAWLLVG